MADELLIDDYFGVGNRSDVVGLIPKLPQDARILEIGCGVGGFRTNFGENIEYWGVEPDSNAAIIAEKRLSNVLHGNYELIKYKLPPSYFDLVVCNDVIEHIDNVDQLLHDIKTLLKPEGFLIGSIPNVRYSDNLYRLMFLKDWNYIDRGILDRTHLRFFTEKSIRRLFELHGYEIYEFYGINPIGIIFTPFKMLIKTSGLIALSFLFGRDSQYRQYAFRVRGLQKSHK